MAKLYSTKKKHANHFQTRLKNINEVYSKKLNFAVHRSGELQLNELNSSFQLFYQFLEILALQEESWYISKSGLVCIKVNILVDDEDYCFWLSLHTYLSCFTFKGVVLPVIFGLCPSHLDS